ncbi:MAG: 3-deoxy-7-phosphoheptulonate synthase class II [Hyphomicrobiaceae bacterium]|nr:3-deoxy-7-phosphoheptulonate synthase class II [Hyphomicrobiaceae bacterium]
MPAAWSPDSWRSKPIVQVPEYDGKPYATPSPALADVEDRLSKFPPLVFANEVLSLKAKLAKVAAGQSFLFQGGDCAESFKEHSANNIRDYFRVFLQSALVMTFAGGMPVVKVGRIAGQFAKPRSSNTEKRDGAELPSYRGDIINGFDFTPADRIPDPQRQLQAYRQSAATLNFLRAFLQGGFASLENVNRWALDFMKDKPIEASYEALARKIGDTLEIMRALGINESNTRELVSTDFYTSHEALLLGYEQAMTRRDEVMGSGRYFDTSAHMIWIGDRTRQPDHAHVEFCRGVANPIGLKCGPSLEPDGLLRLIEILNPANEPGRLTLICRFGSDKVEKHLPALVRAASKAGASVIWSCDPMHGNTITATTGHKTRPFQRVREEVERFFAIHRAEGTHAGGVHLEMTGQNVTECTGGAVQIVDEDLARSYETLCDPRLNAEQSLEIAFLVADLLKLERESRGQKAVPLTTAAAE